MKKLLVALMVFALFLAVQPARAQSNTDVASFPTFGVGEILRANATFHAAMDLLMRKERMVPTVFTLTASDTAAASATYSAIWLTPGPGNTTSNLKLDTTGAKEMQLLYVFNDTATATNIYHGTANTVATCSASGGRAHLMFASGSWRLLEDQ